MGKLFGTNGIRGVPGRDLTDDLVTRVGRAVALRLGKKIVIGYDGRISSPHLAQVLVDAITSTGSDAYLVGLAPTPAIQLFIGKGDFDGGIVVTASHNPPEFNGIKVMGANGVEVPRSVEGEIESLVERNGGRSGVSLGTAHRAEGVIADYINSILAKVDVAAVSASNFKVVVDAGNGAQTVSAPHLLEKLGCKVARVFCEVDGKFPGRGSEPVAEKLTALMEKVKHEKADLGVAYDGDGDRVLFCDEKGTVHTGDRSGALLVDYVLSSGRGDTVVTTVATSNVVDYVVKRNGGRLFKIRVGSVDVTEKMLEEGAVVGLEENGGFFYLPHQPVRDGAMTTALMLEALAKWQISLSAAIRRLPLFHQRKGKLKCPEEAKAAVLVAVKEEADAETDETDGVRVIYDDGSWVIVRPSGTEPLIRVFSESRREDRAEELYRKYLRVTKEAIKKVGKK
jgi:phosphomannomutase/phosphoglucomutase